MAKTRKELESELQELGSKIEIKEDHGNVDLKLFIELEEARLKLKAPAVSLQKDLEQITVLKNDLAKAKESSAPKDLAIIKELEKNVIELNEALEIAEAQNSGVIKHPVGKVDKIAYEVISPRLSYKRKEYTAKQIAEDSNLLAELVSLGSSAVRKVEL